jgi:PAS domain-containing protein
MLSTYAKQCEPRITRQLRRSQALEALQPVLQQIEDRSAPYNPSVQSYYFVSFDGFLRTIPHQPIEALVPHRPFNHASYVVDTLQIPIDRRLTAMSVIDRNDARRRQQCTTLSEDVYVSRPYLDTYGSGIVQTICSRVLLKPEREHVHPQSRASTRTSSTCSPGDPSEVAAEEMRAISESSSEGVFCADVGVDRGFIHRALAANPLFEAELYQFEDHARDQSSIECRKTPATLQQCRRILDANDGRREERFECETLKEPGSVMRETLTKWWCDQKAESSSGYASITPLDSTSQDLAAIVWDNMPTKTSGLHRAQVVVFHMKKTLASWLHVLLAIVCLSLAIAVCARMALMHGRRRSEDLLRGLQVGLVKVNAQEAIVVANAKAEAILDVKLPRFGHRFLNPELAPGRTKFTSLIDETLSLEGAVLDFHVVTRDAGGSFELSSYRDMSRLRERGISSEYWARIRKRDGTASWIRVVGSPILPATFGLDADVHIPGTYGVVERADRRIWPDLERVLPPPAREKEVRHD